MQHSEPSTKRILFLWLTMIAYVLIPQKCSKNLKSYRFFNSAGLFQFLLFFGPHAHNFFFT